ncbi:MAG: hypothetical protein ACRDQ5_16605 [Sciscionella sp.]
MSQSSWDLHLTVAALRADRADVASYARVLTGTLGDALPEGMVDVEYQRGLADRMAGRQGQPVAVTVHCPEHELSLGQAKHGLRAEVRHVVRGVVISRREVDIDDWLALLADELHTLAARDATAREALSRLLDT